MSYGWLTESAQLPKKSKQIKIEDEGSLFGLKAVLMRQRQKIQVGGSKRTIYEIKKKPSANPGIEERIKRDETPSNALQNRLKDSARSMQLKPKVYGELEAVQQNVGILLVDFAGKKLEKEEDQEYLRDREQFYSGKLEELKKNREEAPVSTVGERDYRERMAWEKDVLAMLSGSVEEKEKVKQVFDHRMHADEKQALTTVLKELGEEQKMKDDARKRREQIKEHRLLKLKNLNILPDAPKKCQSQPTSQKNIDTISQQLPQK